MSHRSLYFCRSKRRDDLVKIGISIHPEQRMKEVGGDLILAIELDYDDAAEAERALHRRWADRRIIGEWFRDHDLLELYIKLVRRAYMDWHQAWRAREEARLIEEWRREELRDLLGLE